MKRTLLTALTLFSTFSFGSAVDDRFIQLRNNTAIRAANAANTGVVNLVQSSATDAVVLANALSVASTGGVSLSSSALTLANLASDPGSPSAGDIYFNSVSNKLKFYNGSSWITIEDTDTGITALTGDVTASGSGSQAASVVRIQAVPVSATTPTSGQIFKYNGSQWAPGTDLGITALTSDVTASGVGSQAATVVKIQGRSVSSSAPSANQYLKWNAGSSAWEPTTAPSGVAGAVQFSDGAGNFLSDTANFFWDDTNNRLGLGTSLPSYTFDSTGQMRNSGHIAIGNNAVVDADSMLPFTLSSNLVIDETSTVNNKDEVDGITVSVNYNPASDALATAVAGVDTNVEVDASNSQHLAYMNALNNVVANFGSGLIDTQISALISSANQGTGTITDSYGIYLDASNIGGGTVTNAYGLYINNVQGSNAFAIYENDATAKNYFAGNVGIKTSSPGSALDVKGQVRLSGSTSGYVGLSSPSAPTSYSLVMPSAQGSANQTLKNDGSGNLSWANDIDTGITQLTGDVTAGPGSGSQAASVVKLRGVGVSASSPTTGQVLKYDGSNWAPGTDLGITALTSDVTASGVGSQAATVVKIQGRSVANTAPSNLQVLKWNAGSTQWEPGTAASNTWASVKAYSTDTFNSDNSLSNATAISYPSGGTGSDAARYIATDDNDGTTGDGSIASLNIQAGTYTGTGAFTSITGGDLNLFAGHNHQTGASLGQVTGGNLNLYAGLAVGSGDGGQITINGGTASHGGNGNGGGIILEGGTPSGTGERGSVTLTSSLTHLNSPVMILPRATSDAAAGAQGWLYYNTSTNQVRIHDATVWKDFGTGGTPTGDPNAMAFFDGSGNLTSDPTFTFVASVLTLPADIDPGVSDTWNVGTGTNEYASMWASTFAGITDINLVAGAGSVIGSGDGVSMTANTANVDLTSTSGVINLTATSGTGGVNLLSTTAPILLQSDTVTIQNSAATSAMDIAGTVITPTTSSDLTVSGNIISNATGTRNIGSSSNEYLASWSRAFKGITNVLVQAVSGNATVQGTNVVLSNGTNTLTFTGTSLNPSVNNAISLGSAANNIFSLGRFRSVSAGDGTSTFLQMDGTAGQTFPGGQAISASLRNTSNTGTHIGIYSTNNTTANTVASGNLYIGTGNKTAGNAASGDLLFRVGTPFGTGVRGAFYLQDGSEGTIGSLWASSDATGKSHWITEIKDSSNVGSLDYLGRTLKDTGGGLSIDYGNRTLDDGSAVASVDYGNRNLIDSAANTSVDFENRTLYDGGVTPSFDYTNRVLFDSGSLTIADLAARNLYANDGSSVMLDWSAPGVFNINTAVLTNAAGGSGTVPTLTTTYNVTDARVTTNSQVIVTLQTAAAAVVQSVVPHAGNFDINLTASVISTLDFKYTISENPQ